MLQHVSEFHSYSRLNNISLYVYITFCSSICLLVDTRVASTVWQSWIMLLWAQVYKDLFKTLGHNSVFNFLRNYHTVSIEVAPLYIPINRAQYIQLPCVVYFACPSRSTLYSCWPSSLPLALWPFGLHQQTLSLQLDLANRSFQQKVERQEESEVNKFST